MSEANSPSAERNPKLSVCIATFRRRKFLAATLDSILDQLRDDVEVVIVEGASDNPATDVIEQYRQRYSQIRYHLEPVNSGVDADYDKAVRYARGAYCWLMTDDDLMTPGSLARVMSELDGDVDLVVVDASVWTADFGTLLHADRLSLTASRQYSNPDGKRLFGDLGDGISFIGCVVIKRAYWLSRDRERYFGSLFVHVGVIFQYPPVTKAKVIAEPMVAIRYGNAMWTERGFEIWMYMWPALVWSFDHFPVAERQRVCPREPWKKSRALALYRAIGGYDMAKYRSSLSTRTAGWNRVVAFMIAAMPARLINTALCFVMFCSWRSARSKIYDVARSESATRFSKWMARRILDRAP